MGRSHCSLVRLLHTTGICSCAPLPSLGRSHQSSWDSGIFLSDFQSVTNHCAACLPAVRSLFLCFSDYRCLFDPEERRRRLMCRRYLSFLGTWRKRRRFCTASAVLLPTFSTAELGRIKPRNTTFVFIGFLDASSHLYMRVCPSVGPSVRGSVH